MSSKEKKYNKLAAEKESSNDYHYPADRFQCSGGNHMGRCQRQGRFAEPYGNKWFCQEHFAGMTDEHDKYLEYTESKYFQEWVKDLNEEEKEKILDEFKIVISVKKNEKDEKETVRKLFGPASAKRSYLKKFFEKNVKPFVGEEK